MVLAQQLVTEQGRPGSWNLARHGAGTSWPDERGKGSGVLAAHPDVNGRAKALSGVDPPKNIVRGYVVLITDLTPAL